MFPYIQWKSFVEKILGNLNLPNSTKVLFSGGEYFKKFETLIAETSNR
jgi:hypothetical protein